jgi:DNA-binding MarR family transcriptional regulator
MIAHQADIHRIRDFNRFYTNVIGLVDRHVLHSPYSLSEARILYEIRHSENCTARTIKEMLNIDEGYLSRIIDRFISSGILKKKRSSTDGRAYLLSLTKKGEREFDKLNQASDVSVQRLIEKLSAQDLKELVSMMAGIQKILSQNI